MEQAYSNVIAPKGKTATKTGFSEWLGLSANIVLRASLSAPRNKDPLDFSEQ